VIFIAVHVSVIYIIYVKVFLPHKIQKIIDSIQPLADYHRQKIRTITMTSNNNNQNADTQITQIAWLGDKLNRQSEGEFLTDYLTNKYTIDTAEHNKNFVLNVNADWGFGKTYFLQNLSIELENRQHQVVYFDAWKNDFSDKPMLGFIAEINDALSLFMDKDDSKIQKAKSGIKEKLLKLKSSAAPLMAGFLAKQLVGASFDQIEELFNDEDAPEENATQQNSSGSLQKDVVKTVSSITTKAAEFALKEHSNTKKSIEAFKVNLKDLVDYIQAETGFKLPLFILVDELDRCRPNYAIELLETIKHLFDVDGVYFIVATASHQLSHSVNAVYGNNFESKRYLNRFFDQEYKLATPNQQEYCQFLWDKYIPDKNVFLYLFSDNYYKSSDDENINMNVVLVNLVAQYTRSSLRDIEQAVKLLQAINLTYPDKLYSILVIFLIFCKIRHPDLFIMIKNKWPKLFYLETNEQDIISDYFQLYFDKNINIYRNKYDTFGRKSELITTSLKSTLEQMLAQDGKNIRDLNNDKSDSFSPRGLIIRHFQSQNNGGYQINNPPILKLSHYIEIVEQVGRLT
jgi:hypothetical protein